jgi:membrane protein implicated in regulation of membrane protease activity
VATISWFEDNSWAVWLAVALTLGAVEAATVDFIFLMLAGGAVAGAVTSAFGLGLSWQIAAAVIVSVALLGLVRPKMAARMLGSDPPILGTAAHIGASAVVLESVTVNDGRVKIGGDTWSARVAAGDGPIEAGRTVRVDAIDGATAIVSLPPPAQDLI